MKIKWVAIEQHILIKKFPCTLIVVKELWLLLVSVPAFLLKISKEGQRTCARASSIIGVVFDTRVEGM